MLAADRYPLAATILLRSMIDFALTKSRSARYAHAARHLVDCGILAESISDFGDLVPHFAYVTRLRALHGKKTAFWNALH